MSINGPSGLSSGSPENQEAIKKKILIVEDDEGIRESFARILTVAGYEVFTAANGTEALSILSERHPDIVTMDGGLETKDDTGKVLKAESGLTIAAKMREKNSEVIITMMSGHDLKFEGRGMSKMVIFEKGIAAVEEHIKSLLS